MRKNLMIAMFLVSVLMISFVSASISGYLVRGTAITDSGYTATLQKVDARSGVVTISVETPSGTTEVVRVREGQIAKVGDAEIRTFDLKQGTLFMRGGGNVDLNVSPADITEEMEKSGEESGNTKSHTHLSDYRFLAKPMDIFNIQILNAKVNETNGTIDCKSIGKDYVVLGGGYRLNPNEAVAGYVLVTNGPINERFYQVALRDWNGKIKSGTIYATCARIEPTLHQFSKDY